MRELRGCSTFISLSPCDLAPMRSAAAAVARLLCPEVDVYRQPDIFFQFLQTPSVRFVLYLSKSLVSGGRMALDQADSLSRWVTTSVSILEVGY